MSSEAESWRMASWILIIISLVTFIIQRFYLSFLDLSFEFFIIHLPALFSALIYLRKITKLRK